MHEIVVALLERLNRLWGEIEEARREYYNAFPQTRQEASDRFTLANMNFTACWKELELSGHHPIANNDGTRGFH